MEIGNALTQFSGTDFSITEWADWENHALEVAFKAGRELVTKLASDVDFSQRTVGCGVWDGRRLVKQAAGMQYSRIPSTTKSYAKEGLTILLDVSPSCAEQAEMFAAIAAGALGDGVQVFFSYNGSSYKEPLRATKCFSSYFQAKAWVVSEVRRIEQSGNLSFEEFVRRTNPTRLVIFGDWDGKYQYEKVACHKRGHKWYWFSNEARGRQGEEIPLGWSRKSYLPNILDPQTLVKALRKVH